MRKIVDLLLYGGAYIGLCASCITALTFELTGSVENNFRYITLIGVATAALYCAHRVIGLQKLSHITTSERYVVIRKYQHHIWLYCAGWSLLTIWFLVPLANCKFLLWLIPGGSIAIVYVLPLLSGGRRVRDLGWIKILLIGWSWAWLTAFIPAYFFSKISLLPALFIGIERMIFIVAITIPFEIRDLAIDSSMGMLTMPSKFGLKRSKMIGGVLCGIVMVLALILSFLFRDPPYFLAMLITSVLFLWILKKSDRETDDYFFSGLTDGLMIMALLLYAVIGNQ